MQGERTAMAGKAAMEGNVAGRILWMRQRVFSEGSKLKYNLHSKAGHCMTVEKKVLSEWVKAGKVTWPYRGYKAGQWLLAPVRCWETYVLILDVVLFWRCGDTFRFCAATTSNSLMCLSREHRKCRTMPMVSHAFTQPVCTSHVINTSTF